MRYADGPTVRVDLVVNAPEGAVWDAVIDINLGAVAGREYQGGHWLDDGPRLGARFCGRNAHPAIGEWETTSTVVRFEQGRAFAWAVGDPDDPAATWWFEIDPVGTADSGAVRVTHGARLGPGPSGLTPAILAMPDKEERIVARRLGEWEQNMTATLASLRARLEHTR
ncbi:MAG TPA: hypothetical protein VFP61_01360 [Acidimicrobiales bacterium]|nr:hypothetical protein [Acidimicrobiales bacterium]